MQLGELQNQLPRFQRRNAQIIGISVDAPRASEAMLERLGLQFDLVADVDQNTIRAFGVQNPDTQELALHAVYIVARDGRVVYRKVARRRPVSAELIDAIDAHLGQYPQTDEVNPQRRVSVAYPQNNFQALLEIARAPDKLPSGVNLAAYQRVQTLLTQARGDDAIFAFRRFLNTSAIDDEDALLAVVRHLMKNRFFAQNTAAIEAGLDLDRRLARVRTLQARERAARDTEAHDAALHALAAARAGVTRARANIEQRASAWNLRYVKTSLRGYRELVLAYLRNTT